MLCSEAASTSGLTLTLSTSGAWFAAAGIYHDLFTMLPIYMGVCALWKFAVLPLKAMVL